MSNLPRTSSAAVLQVQIPPAPPNLPNLPKLEVFLFDSRWQKLAQLPFPDQGGEEGGELNFVLHKLSSTGWRLVLGPRGLACQSLASLQGLPTYGVPPGSEHVSLPKSLWTWLERTRLQPLRGHLTGVPEADAELHLEIHCVDRYQWLFCRSDGQISQLRDSMLRLFGGAAEWAGGYFDGDPRKGQGLPAFNPMQAARLEGVALREYLYLHRFQAENFFGLVLPESWYRTELVSELKLGPKDSFETWVGWWCRPGIDPDLYFRVWRLVEGRRRYEYQPLVSSGSLWHYQGWEIELNLGSSPAGFIDKVGELSFAQAAGV